jgi:hypothetical protein
MNLKPFITLTGADERTDLKALARLNAEIGLLYTANPEGRHRYPSWDWIMEAGLILPSCALHVCGRHARNELRLGQLDVSCFDRIQLNGWPSARDVDRICEMYPEHTIITQHSPHCSHLLLGVQSKNHVVLVDASGGKGITPPNWTRPSTSKNVGFAGGLGPDNLQNELLNRLGPYLVPGSWIDMESKLRDGDDWFDLAQASECCRIFHIFQS